MESVALDVARQVLKDVPGGVAAFEPSVRFHTFGEAALGFNVTLKAKEYSDQALLRHEFIKRLKARFESEGIRAPSPPPPVPAPGPSV